MVERLDYLQKLGVNAVELLPVQVIGGIRVGVKAQGDYEEVRRAGVRAPCRGWGGTVPKMPWGGWPLEGGGPLGADEGAHGMMATQHFSLLIH